MYNPSTHAAPASRTELRRRWRWPRPPLPLAKLSSAGVQLPTYPTHLGMEARARRHVYLPAPKKYMIASLCTCQPRKPYATQSLTTPPAWGTWPSTTRPGGRRFLRWRSATAAADGQGPRRAVRHPLAAAELPDCQGGGIRHTWRRSKACRLPNRSPHRQRLRRRKGSGRRSSGCAGKQEGRWLARITYHGTMHSPGYFDDEQEDARAYDAAARRLRPKGEAARHTAGKQAGAGRG